MSIYRLTFCRNILNSAIEQPIGTHEFKNYLQKRTLSKDKKLNKIYENLLNKTVSPIFKDKITMDILRTLRIAVT